MALALRKLENDVQDDFLMVLPEVRRLLRWCFRHAGREQRQELVHEAICNAWGMYSAAHSRGKRLAAHGLAWYSWLQVKSGRRFCTESKRSVKQWASIETVDPEELLAADGKGKWPVCDAAAFRIDWATFADRCTAREARAFALLAIGHRRSHVAKRLDVSPTWMTVHLDRLYEKWLEFQGGNIAEA